MTEQDQEMVERFSTAISNIANECIAAGIDTAVLVKAVSSALRKVLANHAEPEQVAAALRIEAGKVEAMVPSIGRTPDEKELLDLVRRTHEFINSLQVAGIEERVIVTAMGHALIERVVRVSNAGGAVRWLLGLAQTVMGNADHLKTTSKAH